MIGRLQRPRLARVSGGIAQFRPGTAAVREDAAQGRGLAAQPGKDFRRAVAIPNAGAADGARQQVAAGVGDDTALPPLDPLAGIEAGK
jgi:hypothetical protein